MTDKLPWAKIKERYNRQWIELIDYDWPEESPYPRSGILRSHSTDKKDFYQQCQKDPIPEDSAILYVGKPELQEGVVFSPSMIRIEACDE